MAEKDHSEKLLEDYTDVFRVMGYDYASYRRQIDSSEAFRYPVFTLLLYFGTTHWTAPKTTFEALSENTIPYKKYLPKLVSDNKLNVIEVAFLPKEIREQDFFKDEREFRHVEAMIDFFGALTKDRRFLEYQIPITEKAKKGAKVSMFTLFDVAEEKGMEKGMEKGTHIMVTTLRELGLSEQQILQKIQEKFLLDEKEAKMYL